MELEFDRARWTQDGEGFWLCLRVKIPQAARRFAEGMKQAVYTALLTEKRKKRSRDANAYAWALMEEIAAKIGSCKDEVYLQMLERYGVFTHIIVKPQAVDMLMREYRLCRSLGEVTVNGQTGVQIQAYFGSSQYDTKQMSRLIDGIIYEARELGIETATPEEVSLMNSRWGNAQADKIA